MTRSEKRAAARAKQLRAHDDAADRAKARGDMAALIYWRSLANVERGPR